MSEWKKPQPFSPYSLSHLSCHPGYKETFSLSAHHKEQHQDGESSGVAGEPGGTDTSPLRSHTKSSTDFGVGCCWFGSQELWPHAWDYNKSFEMRSWFFSPEFISSSSIWWQFLHGSAGLSLITNSMESPLLCLTHSCIARGGAGSVLQPATSGHLIL